MKLILLQDIAHVGKKGGVKDIADGYARNFLIPQGFAEVTTAESLKRHEQLFKQSVEKKQTDNEKLQRALDELAQKTLEIKLAANEKGEFYQKVTAKTIAEKLKDYGISEADIALDEKSIKKAGEYSIPIRRGSISGNILIKVSAK